MLPFLAVNVPAVGDMAEKIYRKGLMDGILYGIAIVLVPLVLYLLHCSAGGPSREQ